MQQVGRMRNATQAAAAPLVQKASEGVRALLKLVSASESGYFREGDAQAAEIRQQLSSPNTETKLTGLRRAIAAEAACGTGEFAEGPSLFFADVVKNLSTTDFELKRLVYLYLVQHAQEHPDLTLLSINGYQKDLYCTSHVVRAAALKSLSSLSMLEIVQLLVHSLKRAAADTSPLVRKTAAHAAAKIYFLDTDQREEVIGALLQLLGDGEIAVLGAALVSFRLIFFQSLVEGPSSPKGPEVDGLPRQEAPDDLGNGFTGAPLDSQEEALALLHPFYSRLVSLLPQLQPAPQVFAVDLLSRYCRCFFKQPRLAVSGGASSEASSHCGPPASGGQPLDEGPHSSARSSRRESPQRVSAVSVLASRGAGLQQQKGDHKAGGKAAAYQPLPEDFERFRQTLELLLLSDSCAVVVSACAAIQSLFPAASWDCVVVPLLRCFYACPSDYKEPLLKVIASFVSVCPRLFQPHMREFYLKQSDSFPVRQLKLNLLLALALADPSSIAALLPELRVYLHWAGDEGLITSVFGVLTYLALRHKQAQLYCMRLFVSLLDSASPCVAAEAVVGVRTLVQQKQNEQDGETLARLVLHLAAQLSRVTSPAARASVVWVIGNYLDQVSWVAADALRQLTKRFRDEAEEVKLQVLLLATRLWGFHHRNMQEGPLGSSSPSSSSSSSSEGSAAGVTREQGCEQGRLIPPPTREQSRQHFPRLDAMLRYLFEAASYDSSHDVRDMARVYSALTSALSLPEDASSLLPPDQRDMRRFAAMYLHALSGPSSSSASSALGGGGDTPGSRVSEAGAPAGYGALGAWDRSSHDSTLEAGWPWSSLAFYTGLVFPGDVPLPAFALEDTADSLRRCLTEEEALRHSFLSLGVRPPHGGTCNSSTPTAQGPRSICSADVIRMGNAASLMGRVDGGKGPLSQIDLDSFYENDPMADLAHLNGASSSANSTECTGTRSSGVGGVGDGGSTDNNNEGVWAAFEAGGDEQAAVEGGALAAPPLTPPGIVVGEDEESDEEGGGGAEAHAQQQATATCTQETLQAGDHDADWNLSPTVS
ncbi:hypothetical protein ACSSS7_000695 [Eimeria intestinalis]